jgi:hypothetical protein
MSDQQLKPLDPEWFVRSGLLHIVNEAVLWPLGFALGVGRTQNGEIVLGVMESDGPIVPDMDHADHMVMHHAYLGMLASRFSPTEESKASAEARARLVLPR